MIFFQSRRYLVLLSVLFICLLPAYPVEAGVATLYKGNVALGKIPVMDGENGYAVSIADAGALLGLNASVSGEELLLTRGNDRLRVVLNAVAAWHNNQLIPLYGASYIQDGRWWLDVSSLMSLLQRITGRNAGDRLRIEEVQGGTVADTPAALSGTSDTAGTSVDSAIESATSQKPDGGQIATVAPSEKAQESRTTKLPSATSEKPRTPAAGDEIRAVRWSTSREKVRAVLDCSEGANPDLKIAAGKVSVVFAQAVGDLQGIPSPYENVKAELQRSANAVTLVFSASSLRVEKLVLDDPRRIVLDFVFASQEGIKEASRTEDRKPKAAALPVGGETPKKSGKLLVVLDPGHGGKDPGAMGNGLKEKDINLGIGLKMEKALKTKGVDVRMTRNTDVYLTLQERTDIANRANADMFVSIHVNALPPGKNSAGFEIYLMALPTDRDALELAKIENREYVEGRAGDGKASDRKTELLLKILGDMQQNNKISESTSAAEVLFKAGNGSGLPMKRVAQAPFFVLRGAGMPAVLLETGFITNAREAKLLAHAGYQQQIADAMAEGVCSYLR